MLVGRRLLNEKRERKLSIAMSKKCFNCSSPFWFLLCNSGVYYKEPEPEAEGEEEGAHSSPGPPTAARERRDLPLACRGAHGRMKRSCVIIPPPPPKPTTRPKNQPGIKPADEDFQGNKFDPNITERYLMRVFSSNCLFWDDKNENWINKGCQVCECLFDKGYKRN